MSINEKEITTYLNESKTIVLGTVKLGVQPILRTLGGFAVKDLTTYFSTAKGANKVEQIQENNEVAILFEHENQIIPNFINISVNGVAEKIQDSDEFNKAAEIIASRRLQLKINENTHNIYKVKPKEIKILDFSKENPEEKIKVIKF